MLVEDDQFIRELYEMYLREAGFTVTSAEDGQKGVDTFKDGTFDLVLLDILLPEKDGITVLADVKKLNSKVPVAMLTNLFQENLVKKAFELGALGYLLKSRITKKDLIKEVEGFINSQVPLNIP